MPLYLPSARLLVGLVLDHGGDIERGQELLTRIAYALGGNLEGEDYLLLAKYHQQKGDVEAAREAAAEAQRLRPAAASA